jgi:hypothetical protein
VKNIKAPGTFGLRGDLEILAIIVEMTGVRRDDHWHRVDAHWRSR